MADIAHLCSASALVTRMKPQGYYGFSNKTKTTLCWVVYFDQK